MNSSKKIIYRAAIIGAGRIGCGFDSPGSKDVLTHAHALALNPRMKLVALVDKNSARGRKEARRWKTEFFTDIDLMFKKTKPDAVIIATPDETHADMLVRVLEMRPRLVVCEKPVVTARKDIVRVKRAAARAGVPVIVNFGLRFAPSVEELRRDIARGRFGKVLCANGIYVRGILNNGSHMLDLARFLFGEMKKSSAHFMRRDVSGGVPSFAGVASFERCPQFSIQNGGRRYWVFELDLLTEKKRFRITNEGFSLVTQDVVNDPRYKGFRTLGPPSVKKTGLMNAMRALAAHSVRVLDRDEKPRSTLSDALKTHSACLSFAEGFK